jgi:hypothetical protein
MADDGKIFKSRENKSIQLSYDRIMFVMDMQATDGQNVFAMLIGRNQNNDMFSSCYDQRDSRTFGMYDTYWLNIQLATPNAQLLL